jgi:hypothetical protein
MLDDRDEFTTIEELKADMELASFKGYVEDIFLRRVCLPGVTEMGRHKFIEWQLQSYATGLDKALNTLVWNAR